MSDAKTGQIVGAHILGADSEELIHLFAIAMKGGLTVQQLSELIPVHPSFAEAVIGAALRSQPVVPRVPAFGRSGL